MISRLYRQRRRVIWLAFCVCLATLIRAGFVPGVLIVVSAGLSAAIVVVLLAPGSRTWLESFGIAFVGAALLPVPTVTLPFFVPIGAVLAQMLLHGGWWDKTRLRLALTSRQTATLPGHPTEVWQALIPGEGHPDDHWTGTLVDFDTDPDDDLTLYLRHASPDGLAEEMTVTFLDKDAPTQCHYLLERQSGPCTDEAEIRLRLAPTEAGQTRVVSTLYHAALPVRLALGRWMDDAFGDEFDSIAASLSRKRDWSINGLSRRSESDPATISWPSDWPATLRPAGNSASGIPSSGHKA